MNRTYTDTIAYHILTILANTEWVSGRGMKLLPYTEDRIVRALRKLQDADFISCKKTEYGKHYAIRTKGKIQLQKYEPDKYLSLSLTYRKQNQNQIDRSSLVGESIVVFEQAGYSAIDKPDVEKCMREGLEALYYTSREMKPYIYGKMDGGKERKAINASRFSGILFSGTGLVRVYSTFNTALQIRSTNEQNALEPMRVLARRLHGDKNALSTLILGDKHFRAADRIIDNSIQAENPSHRRRKTGAENGAENMTVHSLGHNNLMYLPVIKNALPLLTLFQIPQWESLLNASCVQAVGGRPLQQSRYIDGRGDNGMIFVLISMNLVKLHYMIGLLRLEKPEEGFEVVCLEWQSAFLEALLKRELPDLRVSIAEMPDNTIPSFISYAQRAHPSPA